MRCVQSLEKAEDPLFFTLTLVVAPPLPRLPFGSLKISLHPKARFSRSSEEAPVYPSPLAIVLPCSANPPSESHLRNPQPEVRRDFQIQDSEPTCSENPLPESPFSAPRSESTLHQNSLPFRVSSRLPPPLQSPHSAPLSPNLRPLRGPGIYFCPQSTLPGTSSVESPFTKFLSLLEPPSFKIYLRIPFPLEPPLPSNCLP